MIFILVVSILASNGQPEKYQQEMPSLEVCWATAQDFMAQATPDMIQRGVGVGCYQRQKGEPS